jgi:hypothetical protein
VAIPLSIRKGWRDFETNWSNAATGKNDMPRMPSGGGEQSIADDDSLAKAPGKPKSRSHAGGNRMETV